MTDPRRGSRMMARAETRRDPAEKVRRPIATREGNEAKFRTTPDSERP